MGELTGPVAGFDGLLLRGGKEGEGLREIRKRGGRRRRMGIAHPLFSA